MNSVMTLIKHDLSHNTIIQSEQMPGHYIKANQMYPYSTMLPAMRGRARPGCLRRTFPGRWILDAGCGMLDAGRRGVAAGSLQGPGGQALRGIWRCHEVSCHHPIGQAATGSCPPSCTGMRLARGGQSGSLGAAETA